MGKNETVLKCSFFIFSVEHRTKVSHGCFTGFKQEKEVIPLLITKVVIIIRISKDFVKHLTIKFCGKTWHDVSTFPQRQYQVRVNNEIKYIYSEKMKNLKETLKVKQRAWPWVFKLGCIVLMYNIS